ncbi:putative phage tail protein [Escherichia coli ECC-Z]|nr:putative phage tail protein [Escherichia coli ECC-Z]
MVIEAADNITMKTSEFVLEADRTRINSEVVINGGVIATIFHWPPSVTDVMPLTEVLEWRYKAIQRSGANDE